MKGILVELPGRVPDESPWNIKGFLVEPPGRVVDKTLGTLLVTFLRSQQEVKNSYIKGSMYHNIEGFLVKLLGCFPDKTPWNIKGFSMELFGAGFR